MAIRHPLRYTLEPRTIRAGMGWLTLTVTNVGDESLRNLEVRLNSLDTWSLKVYGLGEHLLLLEPGEQEQVHFRVSAIGSGRLYISLDGWKKEERFHWESPAVLVRVSEEAAELVSLLAMTEPYLIAGRKVRCEATVKGLAEGRDLQLEFWAGSPGGEFDRLAVVEIERIAADEEVRYSAEMTAEQEGAYTVYAYLYDDHKRIGREKEYVYVRTPQE